VVLAAGGARRFGRRKLAVGAGRGTLLGMAAATAMAVTGQRCVVVLGADATRWRAMLAGRRLHVVVNRHWRQGMSGSLRTGIAALPPSATAALVVLADQFAVGPSELRRLAIAWRRHPRLPAAATVDGRPGAPAILPRRLFGQLAALRGDQGARQLFRGGLVPFTPVDLPAAAGDLDEPGDLPAFRRALRARREPAR
jgi:molybdenum cofactor cytidylyltransferase